MWGWIKDAVGGVIGAVNTLLGWIIKIFLLIIVRKQARDSVHREYEKDALETVKEQRDIANQPKLRRDAILERMRKRSRPD